MDLNTIVEVKRPSSADEVSQWQTDTPGWRGHLVVLRAAGKPPTPSSISTLGWPALQASRERARDRGHL